MGGPGSSYPVRPQTVRLAATVFTSRYHTMNLRHIRWTLGLGMLASVAIAAGLSVFILLGTGSGMNLIRRAVVWTIQDQLNGQITIERIELGAEKHLAMHNVTLHLPDTLGGVEVAGMDEIWIRLNGWNALVGEAPLYRVGIDGFRMAYIEDAVGDGRNSLDLLLDDPSRPAGEPESLNGEHSGMPFALHDLQIQNGLFRYFDPRDSTTLNARGVTFRGSVLTPFQVDAEISARHVAFDIGGYGDAVSNMHSAVYFEGDALTIHDLTMEAAQGPPIGFHVTGEISLAVEKTATLDIAANGQVGAILGIMGMENTMPGIFSMAGSLRNSLSDPAIEARFTSPVVRTEYGSFKLATVDMGYARNVLTVTRFRGMHGAGWITGRGLLDFAGESIGYRLQLESPGIVLTALAPALVGDGNELEGEVGFAFEMEGSGFNDPPRRADLNASSTQVSINQYPLRAATASAHYRRGQLEVDLRDESFQANAEGRLGHDGSIQLSGSVDVNDIGNLAPPLKIANLRGSANLDTYLLGTLRRPTVRLAGWVSDFAYADVPLGEMKIEGFLDERHNLTFNAVLDRLEFHAKANLAGDQAVSGYLNVHDLRLRDYLWDDSGWGLDAILKMEGEITGTVQQPLIATRGTVRNLVIRNEALGDTEIEMTVSKDRLDFTMTRTPGPSVFAKGSIELTAQYPYDLQVELYHTSLSPLLSILYKRPIERSTGRFSGNIHAVGLAGYPELSTIKVSLDSLGIIMDNRELHFAAPSTVKLENQVITVDDFRLTGDFGQVMVNGTASLAANGRVDLETVLEGVRLEFISPFLVSNGTFSGAMDGMITLGGTPEAPIINSLLTISDVSYAIEDRTNLLGTVTASALYENQVLHVPALSVQTPLGLSEINLTYPLDLRWAPVDLPDVIPTGERYAASLVVDNLAVAPLREFFEMVPADLDGYIRGRIDVNGSVRDRGDMTGIVALDSLKLFGLQNEFVNTHPIRLRINSEYIETDTLATTIRRINRPGDAQGWLTMHGRLAHGNSEKGTAESDFTIQGEQISLDAVLALANLDLPMGGNMNTRIGITGPVSAQVIDARVSVGQLRYNEVSMDSVAAHIVYSNREIDIRDLRIREEDDTITAYGTIPFDPGRIERTADAKDIALTVEGDDVDLSFLSGIVYDLERIEGMADFRLSIGGSPTSPRSIGQISVRDAALRIRDFEPMFKAEVLEVEVDGSAFTLKPVEFRAGDGRIRVSGDLLLDNLSFAEIKTHADFEQAEVERLGSAKLKIDGSLAWTGNRDHSRVYSVEAPIVVTGVVMHPLSIGDFLFDNTIIRPQGAPDPFLESISLDIAVDIPDLAVENDIAQLAIEGGVAFSNTAQNPLVTGNAIAKDDGEIRYLDTTFDLDVGRVDLTRRVPLENFTALIEYPVERLDPDLTIQARSPRVRDIYGTEYEVELLLSGPVSTSTPQLRAAPFDDIGSEDVASAPLAGPEVISLLTFGLPGITTLGTTNAMAGMGSRAILMATGASAERLLKLDEVQIEGDLFTGNGDQTGSPAQITLSKRINRRARVSYTRLFESSEYTLRLGYQLTDFLFIETFSEQSGEHPQNGIDLRVKFRFR